MRGILSIYAL
jgi:hypothetical protein